MHHALEAVLVVMDELAHDEARLAYCHPTGGADGAAGRKHVLHERLTVLVQNEHALLLLHGRVHQPAPAVHTRHAVTRPERPDDVTVTTDAHHAALGPQNQLPVLWCCAYRVHVLQARVVVTATYRLHLQNKIMVSGNATARVFNYLQTKNIACSCTYDYT